MEKNQRKGNIRESLDPCNGTSGNQSLREKGDFENARNNFEKALKYKPDYLTLFIYEFKTGNLEYSTITRVKFHFFQIDGWYFELSEYNRKGNNSGWLISTLLKINASDKDILTKFIYHE